ncbi:FecCD family ABC transporter permease [Catenuloplanes sp. NPDC051500]|uniref:FecCD family ABC transporter permease n=1 Tax=Catenuloplanes sp. NPDC051500 TaxID=3363959 RepID=UPI00378B2C02
MTLLDTPDAAAPLRRPARIRLLWFVVSLIVLGLALLSSVAFGSRIVGWDAIVDGVSGLTDTIDQAAVYKRVPRTVLAAIVGAALAVSGTVMQGVTRNPLADPGILGVNMGASLAVVVGMTMFGLTTAVNTIWVAILGAAISAVFVYLVGSLGRGGATPLKLALAGTATSAALASLIIAVILPRADVSEQFRSWQIGGVGGGSWDNIRQAGPFLLAGFVISWLSARSLNSLALGDDLAAGLGERVALVRGISAAGAVLLCGAATAVTGPIMFVGLIVPHVCRLLVGLDHRLLMPFAALLGASLLTVSDVVGRVVDRPSEIDVGIITALIGAPFFIYIVRRQKVREL